MQRLLATETRRVESFTEVEILGGRGSIRRWIELLDLITEKSGVVFLSQAKNPGSIRSFEDHGSGKQLHKEKM